MAPDPPVGSHSFPQQKSVEAGGRSSRRSLVLTSTLSPPPPTPHDSNEKPSGLRRLASQRRGGSISYVRNRDCPSDGTSLSIVTSPVSTTLDCPSPPTAPLGRKSRPASWYAEIPAIPEGLETTPVGWAEGSSTARVGQDEESGCGSSGGDDATTGTAPESPSTGEPAFTLDRHQELLTYIATKERKCLDLREELARHEEDLRQLKVEWQALAAQAQPSSAASVMHEKTATPHLSSTSLSLNSASLTTALSTALKPSSDSNPKLFRRPEAEVEVGEGPLTPNAGSPSARRSPHAGDRTRKGSTPARVNCRQSEEDTSSANDLVTWGQTAMAKRWVEGFGNLWELLADKPAHPSASGSPRHSRSASQPIRCLDGRAGFLSPTFSPLSSPRSPGHSLGTVVEEDDSAVTGGGAADTEEAPSSPQTAEAEILQSPIMVPAGRASFSSGGSASDHSSRAAHSHSSSEGSTVATSAEDVLQSLLIPSNGASKADHNPSPKRRSTAPGTSSRGQAPAPLSWAYPVERHGVPPPSKRMHLGAFGSTAESWGGTFSKRWAEIANGDAFLNSKRATLAFVEGLEKSLTDALPSPPPSASSGRPRRSRPPSDPEGSDLAVDAPSSRVSHPSRTAKQPQVAGGRASSVRKKRSDDTSSSASGSKPRKQGKGDVVRESSDDDGDLAGWHF